MLASPSSSPKLSIVIPVFNEAESLNLLHEKIVDVAQTGNLSYQLLLIDDGSTDSSWERITELNAHDPNTTGIRLRRNFGKAAALAAGFDSATGEVLITMDADLQDDPQEIPNLLKKMSEGYDVVSGWKKVRNDPWHKTFPSKIFNFLVGWATGVPLHDHNCGLKAYRREIFDEVKLYGEMHRFVPVLAASRGWKVGEIPVQHHPRQFGHSKYGAKRFIKGLLDLITVYFLTGFRQRPQHLLGSFGLICLLGGSVGLFILLTFWLISRMSEAIPDIHLHERAIFYLSICSLLLGFQMVAVGILAELITAISRPDQSPYSISQTTSSSNVNSRNTNSSNISDTN
ncbi:MAG: Undecaprenyl-phosphate 4-deoxy-4-formamido-L-arabinose transferase [Planctomycetota bacterium]|jgi:dolichol-phosphate mannosyltransferase